MPHTPVLWEFLPQDRGLGSGTTLRRWSWDDRVIAVDQTGTRPGVQNAVPPLRASGNGSVVTTESVQGRSAAEPPRPTRRPRQRSAC
ncbi:hypothetical protein [Umezawaea beigongshangensis]|uniref:hypothetical protein n=1 Tax=Umezawaea beigongshangensis TaxID=2780383 RepID=UPI0027DBE9D5|nr:hypothetical protein [Umezawaea beigongshangensis]